MPNLMFLGPSLENVIETEPGRVPKDYAGIDFSLPPTRPGGRVVFSVHEGPGLKRPINVYAFFVPMDVAPAWEARSPEFFFGGKFSNGSVGIVPDRHVYEVKAAGVKPGAYLVQTVLEYQA